MHDALVPDLRAHAAERGALPAADSATPNSRGHMPPNSSADSSSGVGCIGSDAAQQQLLLLRCCLRRRLRLLLRLRLCHRKRGFSQRESCRSENRCELLITCESRRRSTRHRLWRSCQHGARIKRLFSTRSPNATHAHSRAKSVAVAREVQCQHHRRRKDCVESKHSWSGTPTAAKAAA